MGQVSRAGARLTFSEHPPRSGREQGLLGVQEKPSPSKPSRQTHLGVGGRRASSEPQGALSKRTNTVTAGGGQRGRACPHLATPPWLTQRACGWHCWACSVDPQLTVDSLQKRPLKPGAHVPCWHTPPLPGRLSHRPCTQPQSARADGAGKLRQRYGWLGARMQLGNAGTGAARRGLTAALQSQVIPDSKGERKKQVQSPYSSCPASNTIRKFFCVSDLNPACFRLNCGCLSGMDQTDICLCFQNLNDLWSEPFFLRLYFMS